MSIDSMIGISTTLMGLMGFLVSMQPPVRVRWKICAVLIFILLTGSTITLVVSQSKESMATQSKLSRTLEDLQRSNREIERVQSLNNDLQQHLVDASESIRELAAKNVMLSERNVQTVTGGDSYCYISVASASATGGVLTAVHRGQYPLYSVHARLVDLAKAKTFSSTQQPTLEEVTANDLNIPIGDLAARTAVVLQRITFPATDRLSINIFFSAHNGLWTETLRLRLVEGHWAQAIKILRAQGSKEVPIWEKVDANYPRVAGKVDWGE